MHYYTTNNTTTQKGPFGHRNSFDSLLDCTILNPHTTLKFQFSYYPKRFPIHVVLKFLMHMRITNTLANEKVKKELKSPDGIPPPPPHHEKPIAFTLR